MASDFKVVPPYETRFIKQCETGELLSMWRTARIPCPGRHDQRLKAVEWFKEAHPEYSEGAIYKDLDGLLSE
jgi:hypothetical protein